MKRTQLAWPLFFFIHAVEGLGALVYLAGVAADQENGVLLGYSASRLGLMAVLLAGVLVFAALAVLARRADFRARWLDAQRRPRLFNAILLAAPVVLLVSGLTGEILYSLYQNSGEFRYFAYYERLQPLLIWGMLLGAQTLFFLTALRFAAIKTRAHQTQPAPAGILRTASIVLAIFLMVWVLVALTGIGITRDRVGWGEPTVPLMEWQIWLAWAVGSAALVLAGSPRRSHLPVDALISAALWLTAAVLWLSLPVPPGFFATPGRAPNYEIYPFSDGAFYGHFAQSVLVGNGFKGGAIPPRPLFIALLAALHGLAGEDYTRIIALQTLVLAFLPVALYWLGKELHSRAAGIAMGLMAVLRELTAIHATPFTDDISNSKLFFSDLPTALALVVMLWAVVRWLKRPQDRLAALLAGGLMGVLLLLRTQSLFFIPLVGLGALIVYLRRGGPGWRVGLQAVGLLTLGMALGIGPWLGRNAQLTGHLVFDDPNTQTGVLAQRYTLEDGTDVSQRADENMGEYSNRLFQITLQTVLHHPARVAGFISAHFLNSEIGNLLILPVRSGIRSPGELIWPDHAFWQAWNGRPTASQAGLMGVNLMILSLGLASAWRRVGLAGMMPLLANLSYNLSNAVARNSGLRYLLPADWVCYVYFALGLMELSGLILLAVGRIPQSDSPAPAGLPARPRIRQGVGMGLCILFIGCTPLLAEHLVPQQYPAQTRAQLSARLAAAPALQTSGVDLPALLNLAARPEISLAWGKAIYPRYYDSGEGEPRTAKAGYEPSPDRRMVFLMVSQIYPTVVLKVDEMPADFPHGAEVLLVGCQQSRSMQGLAVVVIKPRPAVYLSPDLAPMLAGVTRCQPKNLTDN